MNSEIAAASATPSDSDDQSDVRGRRVEEGLMGCDEVVRWVDIIPRDKEGGRWVEKGDRWWLGEDRESLNFLSICRCTDVSPFF